MARPIQLPFVAVAALLLAFAAPSASEAQSVPAGEASAFLGDWNVALQGDMPATIRVRITDEGGQTAAVVTGLEGNDVNVRSISRSGENLVLRYDSSLQGQTMPIAITLTPDGDALRASLDVADGMLTVPGRATPR